MSIHDEAAARGAQQKPRELERLHRALVTDRPGAQPIRRVLEIGSWRGGMLWWLRHALQPELLVSIDLSHQAEADVAIVGDSHAASVYDQAAALAPFDVVFIDGDHSYAGVARDWDLYAPLCAAPGAVCFHDIVPHRPELRCHVDQLWAELKQLTWKTLDIVDPLGIEGCGIGVLFVT